MQFLLFDYSMVQMDAVVFSDVWGMEDSRSEGKKGGIGSSTWEINGTGGGVWEV